jgi:hypothetical protein
MQNASFHSTRETKNEQEEKEKKSKIITDLPGPCKD